MANCRQLLLFVPLDNSRRCGAGEPSYIHHTDMASHQWQIQVCTCWSEYLVSSHCSVIIRCDKKYVRYGVWQQIYLMYMYNCLQIFLPVKNKSSVTFSILCTEDLLPWGEKDIVPMQFALKSTRRMIFRWSEFIWQLVNVMFVLIAFDFSNLHIYAVAIYIMLS